MIRLEILTDKAPSTSQADATVQTAAEQKPGKETYIHHTYITFISPRIYKGSCIANFSECRN